MKNRLIIGLLCIIIGVLSTFVDGDITPCVFLTMVGLALICTKDEVFDC